MIGKAEDLFDEYQHFLEAALEEFCDIYWPCSYVSLKGQKCVNVRSRHSPKGHQNEKGRIIGTGVYYSNFSAETYKKEWLSTLRHRLIALEQELQRRDTEMGKDVPDPATARTLHKEVISEAFKNFGTAAYYISHTTCFCCLKEVPQHGLPCGHVLCSACVKAFKTDQSATFVTLDSCPLHPFEPFPEQWRIAMKPDYAGVRVLSLDG